MIPHVSVLWVNYNSMHLIDITKKSIDALLQLNYSNLEVILVDNNSSDGSGEVIEKYLWQKKNDHMLNVKFVKLDKNWGWAGAVNRAYNIRNPDSKYLALTHNDVVPNPDYLTKVVNFMEKHEDVGAVQGIVVKLGAESVVDSSGFMMNEALLVSSLFNDGSVAKILSKPASVSMVEGTMPVYNLNAMKSTLGDGKELFVTAGFMYYLEDAFTSLRLWAHGYKCVVLPFVTGAHYRMGTSKKAAKKQDLFYYLLRNRIALLYMTNSAGKLGFITQNLRKLVISNRTPAERKAIFISLIDGIRLGRQLKRQYGSINVYAAPLIRPPLKTRLIRWMH
jgi:GT2 family glycosyltransferase